MEWLNLYPIQINMKIQFLGQGYEPISENSVGNHLIKLLAERKFHTFTAISAFISQAGVNGLSTYIEEAREHLEVITIITGVDQKGTSKEALEALIELNVNAYVFYQPSITIFHPKIYLFEGIDESALIVGSSNLTAQGLFSNIEASILVQVDNREEKKNVVVEELKKYYKGLFDLTEPNLKQLNQALIDDLVKMKVVPTEKERKAVQDKPEESETRKLIYKIFPKRAIARIPATFRKLRKSKKSKPSNKKKKTSKTVSIPNYRDEPTVLLWESGALTQRDLNIPTGKNTNPTGSMLFKKGKKKNIDQRHFFRDEVFQSLDWKPDEKANLSHLERAKAVFKIIVQGTDEGDFELRLSHNTKIDTKTYKQKNSMTSISWGDAKKVIAKNELIGKTEKLYKNKNHNDQFVLIFD